MLRKKGTGGRRHCGQCGRSLGTKNLTGRCRTRHSDPEYVEFFETQVLKGHPKMNKRRREQMQLSQPSPE